MAEISPKCIGCIQAYYQLPKRRSLRHNKPNPEKNFETINAQIGEVKAMLISLIKKLRK